MIASWLASLRDGFAALAPDRFPYAKFALALPLGILGGLLFVWLRLPLPWMLGAMTACTLASLTRLPVAAPSAIRPPMSAAIGVMLGSGFTPALVKALPSWLPAIMGLLLFMIAAGISAVWYFRRVGGFDPITAFFAGMPGGLNEMIELGEARGGDTRLIALVHAARIFLVVMTLPFLIQWLSGVSLSRTGGIGVSMFAAPLSAELWLIGCGLAGSFVGHVLGLPAKALLGSMLVSALVHALGLTDFKAPYEIVNAAQVVLGVVVGCRFAGSAPKLILRVIALSIGSTAILVAWTMMFAWGVAALAGYDARTLVLAYSPGGLAEMSLIAVALNTEVAFVAGLHVIRIALVMMLADRVFRWVGPKQPPRHSG